MPGIIYSDYFIPNNYISVEEAVRNSPDFKLPAEFDSYETLFKRQREIGFDKVAIGTYETNVITFTNLMTDLINKTHVNPEEINYLIETDPVLFNVNHSNINITHYLKMKFGMNNAAVFALSQNCSAVSLAIGLTLETIRNKGGYAIILSNNISPCRNRAVPQWAGVQGDGASILLVGKEPYEYEIVDYKSSSYGYPSYRDYLRTQNDVPDNKYLIAMHNHCIKEIKKFLETNSVSINDVCMMIPQSTNRYTYLQIYASALGISEDKIFLDNIPRGGHMGNVDVARNLKDFTKLYSPHKDALVLMITAGYELSGDHTIGAILLRYKNGVSFE